MHIFFSGIGGTAIGPLSLIARQAGYDVSGSDKRDSSYIHYLQQQGLDTIHIGQTYEAIAERHAKQPIDWYVYSSSVALENPNHPELRFCKEHGIKMSKRDELLNEILQDKSLKLLAVAGTHGKTTTTAMLVWLFRQINVPVSYSVGAKLSFGDMGQFDAASEYFVYECDEFDYNFLAFHPYLSIITGVDYDHHEIFPTREHYKKAFVQFIDQSDRTFLWRSDQDYLGLSKQPTYTILDDEAAELNDIKLAGLVNRRDAWQVVKAVHKLTHQPLDELIAAMNRFPGLSRRFEKLAENLYTDYAHTVEKIKGCLQTAHELSSNIVVVYEPLTNRRQHYIKAAYKTLFHDVKNLYWVPSYLAREDPQQTVLQPKELIAEMDNANIAEAAELDDHLWKKIIEHRHAGDLVVCISGGGGDSLDEWARAQLAKEHRL